MAEDRRDDDGDDRADERETVILTQPEGERLALDHRGEVAFEHRTLSGAPLVHMFCWEEEEACPVQVSGAVTVVGDPQAPVALQMSHRFEDVHRQHLDVAPVDHHLRVDSAPGAPIHHALQMQSPLQVRFCNAWQSISDYTVSVRMGERTVLSINLTGGTSATPQPCLPDDFKPPAVITTKRGV
jgi:hypothetical protein